MNVELIRTLSCVVTCAAAVSINARAALPVIADCQLFPANSVWNTPIDHLPVDANSATYINTIGFNVGLHPDFGTVWAGAPNGIPYVVVPADQPLVNVSFKWPDECDPGPYPIPPIRRLKVVQTALVIGTFSFCSMIHAYSTSCIALFRRKTVRGLQIPAQSLI